MSKVFLKKVEGVIKPLKKCKVISLAGHLSIFTHFCSEQGTALSIFQPPILQGRCCIFGLNWNLTLWPRLKPQQHLAFSRKWAHDHIYASHCLFHTFLLSGISQNQCGTEDAADGRTAIVQPACFLADSANELLSSFLQCYSSFLKVEARKYF